jgi:uncharacterized protein
VRVRVKVKVKVKVRVRVKVSESESEGEAPVCVALPGRRSWWMKPKIEHIEVRHNSAERRFEAEVEGQLSVADYQLQGNRMIFTHTYTPPPQRGRGIAEKLVRAALEHARDEGRKVVPACSYVDAFIMRHPEFKPLLA